MEELLKTIGGIAVLFFGYDKLSENGQRQLHLIFDLIVYGLRFFLIAAIMFSVGWGISYDYEPLRIITMFVIMTLCAVGYWWSVDLIYEHRK